MTRQDHTISPSHLPKAITSYLAAHQARDIDTALSHYTDDAAVTDEGNTYRGHDQIGKWLRRSASEYTYTIELTAATRIDKDHYVATHHLEGDFPGGVVDLRFQFTLRDGRIAQLIIEP
ncbi:MAG: nuclear transport factor 2 family protein [Pseudonocardia sp.]|nr:nuclear transport factor 2 family protein [Pseudonocardia sp.]